MKIVAINLTEGNNLEVYCDRKKKREKEWKALLDDPKNSYNPVTFYREYGCYPKYTEIICVGEPETIQEKLIQRVYSNSVVYERMSKEFPEDLVEGRTSWDDLKRYADDMASFINELTRMII